jgi:hypothetical protein
MVKIPVVQQPEFTIYFEQYGGETFTHADVYKWDKETRNRFIDAHAILHALHTKPFYCLVDNKKLSKFVYLLGYKPHQEIECVDGLTRHIWIYNGED